MDKIGIISGSGILPHLVANEARTKNIEPYFVFIKGSANENFDNIKSKKSSNIKLPTSNYIWSSITSVGKILEYFRENEVKKIILAGGINRPPLFSLIPDLTGAKLLSRLLKLKRAGDDSLLKEIIKFLEEEKFEVTGVQEIAPNLLTKKGYITKTKPNERQQYDIQYGVEVAKTLGTLDIGQAAIVQDGEILGVESVEGTAELIKRCAKLQRGGKGAILIKSCKPNQDKRIDLPSIGTGTLDSLEKLGYAGIALSADESIILDVEEVIYYADKNKIFIVGV